MKRYLEELISKDLKEKIVLLSGPRQVGKTTLSKQLTSSNVYLNYDAASDRRIIHAQEWERDSRPLCVVEVRVSEEILSPSLFRFHRKLENAKLIRIVYRLRCKKPEDAVRMLPAHDFLGDLQLL